MPLEARKLCRGREPFAMIAGCFAVVALRIEKVCFRRSPDLLLWVFNTVIIARSEWEEPLIDFL